jgi:hypothetical protein
MNLYTLPDITATGSAQALSATSQPCKWFQVTGVSVASTIRIGGPNVSASRGAIIYGAGSQFAPPVAQFTETYDLMNVYILGTASDTVSVLYAV